MLTTTIVRIVEFCVRHARGVAVAFLLVGLARGPIRPAVHFKINSDVNDLLSNDLAWRKREKAFEQSFDRMKMLYAVVEAPMPELTSQATAALAASAGAGQGPFPRTSPISPGCRSSRRTACCS